MSGPKRTTAQLAEDRRRALQRRLEQERREREEAERRQLEADRRAAGDKLLRFRALLDAVDAEFLNQWTADGQTALSDDLSALEAQQADADPAATEAKLTQLQQRLDALRAEADHAYTRDQTRREVVQGLIDALHTMGGTAQARRKDPALPAGEVLIDATLPPDQSFHLELNLDLEQMPTLLPENPPDKPGGTSRCRRFMEQLGALLAKAGISLRVDDWGRDAPRHLDPVQADVSNGQTREQDGDT